MLPQSNGNTVQRFNTSGRYYLYANKRYASWGDVNYGINYYQWNDTTSTNDTDNPVFRWNEYGLLLPPNTVIKRVIIQGRTNATTSIDDVEFAVAMLNLSGDTSDGIQASDVTQTNLLLGQSWQGSDNVPLSTRKLKVIDIPDHAPSEHWSNLVVGARGVNNTLTRYFYANIHVEYEVKQ